MQDLEQRREEMTNALMNFSYKDQEVRTIMIDGQPWWVLKDICNILELGTVSKVAERLKNGEVRLTHLIPDALGRAQETFVVNEPGLYRVIFRSDKPEAQNFQDWVYNDVLPQIRKTGSYGEPQLPTVINADMMQRITDNMRALEQKVEEQGVMIAAQGQQIAEMQPKVDYFDVVLQSPDLVTTNMIAKDYGMSARAFNRLLHDMGVQYKQSGVWLLYAKHASNGYTKVCTTTFRHKDGTDGTREWMKWTQKGRLWLYNMLKEEGTLPLIEREETA